MIDDAVFVLRYCFFWLGCFPDNIGRIGSFLARGSRFGRLPVALHRCLIRFPDNVYETALRCLRHAGKQSLGELCHIFISRCVVVSRNFLCPSCLRHDLDRSLLGVGDAELFFAFCSFRPNRF